MVQADANASPKDSADAQDTKFAGKSNLPVAKHERV
eukprot:CAMPEP_0198223890 /NCGR_PEP_ID=MMETSP1445-20131203/94520_1 /TAXON_ID=36898 /ORGANISM="Pyramimonas sp., Strain CCMP2087" /LENGTH=35 /DNA_ID= /DNA_START= /DNA_END= /DNA_ORIENTATION=